MRVSSGADLLADPPSLLEFGDPGVHVPERHEVLAEIASGPALLGPRARRRDRLERLPGDRRRLAVPSGAHQPARVPDEDPRPFRAGRIGRDEADRLEVLGAGILVPAGQPQAVAESPVDDAGARRVGVLVDPAESLPEPLDRPLRLAGIVGGMGGGPSKLDGVGIALGRLDA